MVETHPQQMPLERIVSGGQTGVDRGALDAALDAKLPVGGWCPADRTAEDGTIPSRYPLTPLPNGGYRERTLRNVLDSDGTVILCNSSGAGSTRLRGGTRLTHELCRRHAKPHLVINAAAVTAPMAAARIAGFVNEHRIRVLNIAGPRASQWPQAHDYAWRTVRELLR